jgi:hypothetical protein
MDETKEDDKKEQRIRAITRLYYSNQRVIEAMTRFSQDREDILMVSGKGLIRYNIPLI